MSTVSVIIPYGGSAVDYLKTQLDAVEAAVVRARESGISSHVYVGANSASAYSEASELASGADNVTVVDASLRRGPSFARNQAAQASDGQFLLFCDADDAVDADWIIELMHGLEDAEVVAGVRRHDLLNDPVERTGWRNDVADVEVAYHHLPYAPLSNLAMPRSLYLEIGGCDESFVAGEDMDLCWRAQYAGGRFAIAPRAAVEYRLRRGLRVQFVQSFRYGLGDAQLVQKHRKRGPQRKPKETARAIAGMASQSVKFVIGYRRPVACYVIGHTAGRLVGSIRRGVWIV